MNTQDRTGTPPETRGSWHSFTDPTRDDGHIVYVRQEQQHFKCRVTLELPPEHDISRFDPLHYNIDTTYIDTDNCIYVSQLIEFAPWPYGWDRWARHAMTGVYVETLRHMQELAGIENES